MAALETRGVNHARPPAGTRRTPLQQSVAGGGAAAAAVSGYPSLFPPATLPHNTSCLYTNSALA